MSSRRCIFVGLAVSSVLLGQKGRLGCDRGAMGAKVFPQPGLEGIVGCGRERGELFLANCAAFYAGQPLSLRQSQIRTAPAVWYYESVLKTRNHKQGS
jgi:hypothetical protein